MDRSGSLGLALAKEGRPPQVPEPRDDREVSLRKILRHDNPTFLMASIGTVLFAFSVLFWIVETLDGGRGPSRRPVDLEATRAFMSVTAVLMASLCALAWLRAWRIRGLIGVGDLVQATTGKVSTAKGTSRVRFEYEHGGERRSMRRTIRRSERDRALRPGDSFAILVDPVRPKRVVPTGLYDGD
ncbi:MAG: hypothetical protein L0323_11510 [Planctomycetes bacterium]|nr:hypothetical protein [Planctomycetota bacterium]